MKIIFWNCNLKDSEDIINDIVISEVPDIIILAEVNNNYEGEIINYTKVPNVGCSRIDVYAKNNTSLSLGLQNTYYTGIYLGDYNINLIGVHFPSQMYQSFDGIKKVIRKFKESIQRDIGFSSKENIVFIGDFNVSPYDPPMIGFDGLAATNSLSSRFKKKHLGESTEFYYNPTWKLYNESGFPGSFNYSRPSATSFDIIENHLLDQVVVSKLFIDNFNKFEVSLIKNTNNYSYFSLASSKILISDHLPLKFEIHI